MPDARQNPLQECPPRMDRAIPSKDPDEDRCARQSACSTRGVVWHNESSAHLRGGRAPAAEPGAPPTGAQGFRRTRSSSLTLRGARGRPSPNPPFPWLQPMAQPMGEHSREVVAVRGRAPATTAVGHAASGKQEQGHLGARTTGATPTTQISKVGRPLVLIHHTFAWKPTSKGQGLVPRNIQESQRLVHRKLHLGVAMPSNHDDKRDRPTSHNHTFALRRLCSQECACVASGACTQVPKKRSRLQTGARRGRAGARAAQRSGEKRGDGRKGGALSKAAGGTPAMRASLRVLRSQPHTQTQP